jgi:hypothetical protein
MSYAEETEPFLHEYYVHVPGEFAKLRKATISIVTSICPSFRMEERGSHWRDFHEFDM